MKENVVGVLIFLLDNYLGAETPSDVDEAHLTSELEEAGFHTKEINQAFDWLGELANINETALSWASAPTSGIRIYSTEELDKLGLSSRGFLLKLETMGVLDPTTREIIIDRAMAIEGERLPLHCFKKIAYLIMMNRQPSEEVLAWLEDVIYQGESHIH